MAMIKNITRQEVVSLIRSFLNGSIGDWEWDDFISAPQRDPEIEAVRQRLIAIYDEFPAGKSGGYCNNGGLIELTRIADVLEAPSHGDEEPI